MHPQPAAGTLIINPLSVVEDWGQALCASVIAGATAGYYLGINEGKRQHATEEAKVTSNILRQSKEISVTPQLREYLKGRLYWNGAIYLPKQWARGLVKDYGDVDLEILGGIDYRKDPTFAHVELMDRSLAKLKQ